MLHWNNKKEKQDFSLENITIGKNVKCQERVKKLETGNQGCKKQLPK